MCQCFDHFQPGKTSLKDRFRKSGTKTADSGNTIVNWIREKEASCYICDHFAQTYARYLDTFFYLFKKEADFRQKVADSKGFCLHHFADLCEAADQKLSDKEKESFYEMILPLMKENFQRIHGDVAWLIEKFDYRNKDADWKNSRDAIPRAMQKLKGGYPADPPYQANR